MKKIVSLLLVTLMILSAFTLCFSSSAEAANKDPKFAAADSMVIEQPQQADKDRLNKKCFYALGGGLNSPGGLCDKDYTSSKVASNSNKKFEISAQTSANTVDIQAVQKENGYCAIISYKLQEGTKKSIVVTVPSSSTSVPNALDFYACDDFWAEAADNVYNKPIDSSANRNHTFTLVLSVKDLAGKWKMSTDETYRYYEADFDREFTNNFLAIGFYSDPTRADASKPTYTLNEIAVFSSSIAEPAPVNPGTNSSATNPTTGDNFTLMTVLSLGAVLTAAAVVVKVRKKED